MRIIGALPPRVADAYGEGHFGAPRGSRTHRGQDFACYPGAEILAPCSGQVTKLGYAYEDDLSYRYVQITDAQEAMVRTFYIEPLVGVGDWVEWERTPIGVVQDLRERYPDDRRHPGGIIPHVHLEIRVIGEDGRLTYVDPADYNGGLARRT